MTRTGKPERGEVPPEAEGNDCRNAAIGDCDYCGTANRPIHDAQCGWTMCWPCWLEGPHHVCVRCAFKGLTAQLLEVSSGAPLCHPCFEKLCRSTARPANPKGPRLT